ncbi:hypothetical protein C8F01DRAFT_47957 [Mycena amicta]|nr:hypothetical protein C8F01DRAFT_47957 [Mycena amicta]
MSQFGRRLSICGTVLLPFISICFWREVDLYSGLRASQLSNVTHDMNPQALRGSTNSCALIPSLAGLRTRTEPGFDIALQAVLLAFKFACIPKWSPTLVPVLGSEVQIGFRRRCEEGARLFLAVVGMGCNPSSKYWEKVRADSRIIPVQGREIREHVPIWRAAFGAAPIPFLPQRNLACCQSIQRLKFVLTSLSALECSP